MSLTFDSWTSLTGDPFLGITAHYIYSPLDKPQQWVLKTDQLAFTPITGNHSGKNIAKILLEAIDAFDLREKVCCLTLRLLAITHLFISWDGLPPIMPPITTQLFESSQSILIQRVRNGIPIKAVYGESSICNQALCSLTFGFAVAWSMLCI